MLNILLIMVFGLSLRRPIAPSLMSLKSLKSLSPSVSNLLKTKNALEGNRES